MTGFPGDTAESSKDTARVIPLGTLDPATIHRARSMNTNTLRAMDGVLDQIADRRDRP